MDARAMVDAPAVDFDADRLIETVTRMRVALERIANMKDRDGNEIELHREELRAIARTALKSCAVTGLPTSGLPKLD